MKNGSGGSFGNREMESKCVRVLCRRLITAAACSSEPTLHWLIGSPFFLPPFTVVSVVKCLHWDPSLGLESIDFTREADDLKTLLLRGLDVVGALFVGNRDVKENPSKAIAASVRVRHLLSDDKGNYNMIGATFDMFTKDVIFFVSGDEKSKAFEALPTVVYEDHPEKYLWERGCLLKCDLAFKLPIYVPIDTNSDAEELFSSAIDAAAAKFRDPKTMFLLEVMSISSEETIPPVVLHGAELDLHMGLLTDILLKDDAIESAKEALTCSFFFSKSKRSSLSTVKENADIIQVRLFSNQSESIHTSGAPLAEYFPATVPATCCVPNLKLDILCYAAKNFPLASAISKLIIPGLIDQLLSLKKAISPKLLSQHPKLCPYHFFPPGSLHPITAIYDLTYGEMEMKQVEIRRSLHQRLGFPLDRPLLLIANALSFGTNCTGRSDSVRNGSTLLKDVHHEIPSSGVSGGFVSSIEGSYEYYHYLQDGFDDSGWGCAYRSLQTIISWFKLQHYTSIKVPSHREIQQALVEIGDKEPAFVGSHEWIGAIELSFVLDKLLGVSCKIINVRSGSELPEKCRELALHFETQGTPVMIGGGVLAYTLLGVHFNDVSGDCAFLILDPHYTGVDEHKRIVTGGWCGWKKPVDSKVRAPLPLPLRSVVVDLPYALAADDEDTTPCGPSGPGATMQHRAMRTAAAVRPPIIPTPPPPAAPTPSPPRHDHDPISTRHPLLAALARCRTPQQARRAHALLVTSGLAPHPFAASKLVHLLATLPTIPSSSCSSPLDYAGLVLRCTPSPTLFTYNTLIRALSDSSPSARPANPALLLFRSLLRGPSRPLPNQYTFAFALNSCCRRPGEGTDGWDGGAGPLVVSEAEQVTCQAVRRGLQTNQFVCNVLIKVYGSWGRMEEAERVFGGCAGRDLFSWNSLMGGYVGVGKVDRARKLFDEMPNRDVVSWSTVIAGYVQVGSFMEAVKLFHEMQMSDVTPNQFTLTSILAACANLVALDQGRWVHFYIRRAKIKMNGRLLAGLIDMYAKCGEINSALKVFDEEEVLKQTVWPWNSMLSGLAIHGKSKEVIDLFERMKSRNVPPNKVTFVSLLSACSHGSLLEEGRFYFESMKDAHGIDPEIEHYGCMVDLLGRAGLLKEAEEFISLMPMSPDFVTWSALLSACRIHKDIERAGRIGKIIGELEPEQVGCQVLLANIYSGHGRWAGAKDIRNELKMSGKRKTPGCSSIELNGMFHQFLVGDCSHPQTKRIYSFLDDMGIKLKNAGYEPEIGEVLVDIDEEEKETALSRHSEKLAIAFGLMNTPPGTMIRIVKNLRVCLDCHHATKFISKIYDREIIVRDRIRFHHFRCGLCSCKDYW